MPKATLKYEFDLPEERDDFEIYSHPIDYYMAFVEFGEWLRQQVKYSERSEEAYNVLDEVREQWYTIVNENNVRTD